MKITADVTQLHSGENLARKLIFTVDEQFLGKKAKIGFITPKGRIYFTGELPYENGEGEYTIPASLLDGRGVLHCQLFLWDSSEFLGKSSITEIPVYPSVDDIDCPVIDEDTKKSLALIFEYLEKKADKDHIHDDRYYTKEHIDSVLGDGLNSEHNHDGRYYTQSEINSMIDDVLYTKEQTEELLAEKADKADTYTKEEVGLKICDSYKEVQSELEDISDTMNSELQSINLKLISAATVAQVQQKADKSEVYTKDRIDTMLEGTAAAGHNHDGRYYSQSEINSMVDAMLYTKEQTDELLAEKTDVSDFSEVCEAIVLAFTNLETMIDSKSEIDHSHPDIYTKTETNNLLADKADKSQSYTKAETNDLLARNYTKQETDVLLTGKADKVTTYTKTETNNLLAGKADKSQSYTKTETNDLLAVKADSSYVQDVCLHTIRIPLFAHIDNSEFMQKISACAATWLEASGSGEVQYGSLSTDNTDYMATRINPMLYATRSNKAFTTTYRDIWQDIYLNKSDADGKSKTVNCITLCNMLVMGVPYEGSRLNGHENAIGMSGYAFDACKLIGNSIVGSNRIVTYNGNQKLDINTFEHILTQDSFFNTYKTWGLTKTVKSTKTATDGQIWYDEIRPGDVLWADNSHSLFCLSVAAEGGKVTISGIDASTANNISNFSFTVTDNGVIDGINYSRIVQVARPYYSHSASDTGDTSDCKKLKGPFIGIGADTDLNTLLTVGEYRCISASNVSSAFHKPSDVDSVFRLTVENLTKDNPELTTKNNFLQTLRTGKGEVYTRTIETKGSMDDLTISPWQKASTKDHTVRYLSAGKDLNTIVRVGEYRCLESATAVTIKNRPDGVSIAFRMIVDNTIGDTFEIHEGQYFTQRLRLIDGEEYWRRIYADSNDNPSFGKWHHVLTEEVNSITS